MTPRNIIDPAVIATGLGGYLTDLPLWAAAIAIVLGMIRIYEWARVVIFKHPPR